MAPHPRLPIRIEIDAEREARDAFLWYADRNPRAAVRFEEELDHALARIAESPDAFPETEPGVRRAMFSRFPYTILYAVEQAAIVILAIAHTHRRPGYWRSR